ncbi:transmembrane protein 17B-like [Candoia aspera]|uniref:transmembrane protein 17B-like n=1 Tax=Candoia aspera TaxID=51853 RepID=UPI002FD82261
MPIQKGVELHSGTPPSQCLHLPSRASPAKVWVSSPSVGQQTSFRSATGRWGSPPLCVSGYTMLSSLPLQMLLYFNAFYFPFWSLSEVIMLELKFGLLPTYYRFLLVAAYLTLVGAESLRLYLGYIGNLQEKVPELAGFLLLSFLIEMPVLLFILTDNHVIQMPLEMAVHGVLLLFLTSEIVAASFALKVMAKHLAMQFYLMQFEARPDRVRPWGLRVGNQASLSSEPAPRSVQWHNSPLPAIQMNSCKPKRSRATGNEGSGQN